MRTVLQNILMILIVVVFTGNLAIPHICFDEENTIKTEQQADVQKAADSHSSEAKDTDHCCMVHHCCIAKLANTSPQISMAATAGEIKLSARANDHFTSLDFKGLDRPPKFFA